MDIEELLREVDFVRRRGGTPAITGVEYDSRRIQRGSVFVAMRGGTTDGNRYIDKAIQQGAAAVVTDSAEAFDACSTQMPELAMVQVEHGRRALAQLSCQLLRRIPNKS